MSEYGVKTRYMFVDFKATYDSINREGLKAVEEFYVTRKLRGLVELTFKTIRCRVQSGNGMNEPFLIKKWLRQGDALLCLLFNLALEKFMRGADVDIRGTMLHTSAYVDDDVIVSRYERVIRKPFKKFKKAAEQIRLGKIKLMAVSNQKKRKTMYYNR
jgi:sorting nexin-29